MHTDTTECWPVTARYLIPVALFVTTFLVFVPALSNGFVWDDVPNLVDNLHYRGLGRTELTWMWTATRLGHYIPVTWMSFGLDALVWGERPFGYHLTNLLLHSASAVIFYLVAWRLLAVAQPQSGRARDLALPAGAAFAALFFSLHPLRAESVAWVTERRDVLCGLFWLLSMLAYLRYCEAVSRSSGNASLYLSASLGAFVLALLSKSIAVSLPAILLILDAYPLGRLARSLRWWDWNEPEVRRLWAEKIPFFLASGIAGVVAIAAVTRGASLTPLAILSVADRLAVALYGLTFYLWKTAAPVGLSPFYELEAPVSLVSWPFVLSTVFVAAAATLAISWRREWPALAAGGLAYAAILFPVSGILQNGGQVAADRYSYLASLPCAMLLGGALARYWPRTGGPTRLARRIRLGLPAVLLAALGFLTWNQVQVWRDDERLWRHALETAPSSMAHNNLGLKLAARQEWTGAIHHYREALRIRPRYADAEYNWGWALAKQGQWAAATDHFREAIRDEPNFAAAENSWGLALLTQGQWEAGIEHFAKAVRIDPGYTPARTNLDLALSRLGLTRQPR